MIAILNSLVFDYLVRFRVSTHLNYTYLSQIVNPRSIPEESVQKVLSLSCTTPELALLWEEEIGSPWNYDVSPKDPWERAELRAEIDAIVAEMYGLSVEEYARVLTSFPLMDRKFGALEGDCFLTESNDGIKANRNKIEGVHWIENSAGVFELKARSFITRDFALCTYMQRKKYQIPSDLEKWYRKKVKLDPTGALSRFRIGKEKNLLNRIGRAREMGAVPYIPS